MINLSGINLGDGGSGGSAENAVLYTPQTLTTTQKQQARQNIGSASAQYGVIRQTQTWESDYSGYTMSNKVYGMIPQSNIDLFVSAGATFNSTTGYFELNGLTDISYEEMIEIYKWTGNKKVTDVSAFFCVSSNIRTTLPLLGYERVRSFCGDILFRSLFGCFMDSNVEVISFSESEAYNLKRNVYYISTDSGTIYRYIVRNCKYLLSVVNILYVNDATDIQGLFENCYRLRDVKINSLKTNIDVSQSKNLSNESILYMIQYAQSTPNIVITLHADAYARATADEDIQAMLETHTNVSLASA